MGRKLARETAFKVIYKSLFLNDLSCDEIIEEDSIDVDNSRFVNDIVGLYEKNKEEIDDKINSKLQGYTPDRVYRIDRAILSEAVTEIFYYKETPYKIVVNEAVEMAKKYSTEKSYSFINGILKKIIEDENVI